MRTEVQERVVRLALPTKNNGQKKRRYFSGYVLGNGIIITCRHGFADADGTYDNQRPVLVQIPSQDAKEADQEIAFKETTLQGLVNEGVILFESKEYDIVLLQCERAIGDFDSLFLDKLEEPGKWESGGYPYYNRENRDTAGMELFSGSFESVIFEGKHLQLNVTTELANMKDWREASGSPVFIQEKLAGILRRYFQYDSSGNKQIIPNRLTAIYLKRLWDTDDNFRHILGQLNNGYSTKSKKIIELAGKIIAKRTGLKSSLTDTTKPSQFARELVTRNLPDFLQRLEQLDTNQDDKRILALTLLPWYFINQSVVIDQSAKGAIDIDCVYDVAAECSMAAFDNRTAYIDAYRLGDNETDQDYKPIVTRGKFALSPECGVDEGAQKSIDALNNAILSSAGLDKVLLERFTREGDNFPKLIVKNHLKEARKKGSSYYLVVNFDASSPELEKIRKYKEAYPDLIILNLEAEDETLAEQQIPLLSKLPTIIAERKHDDE